MRLHDLTPAPGSRKNRKRIGRGNAAGQGTTAGKGTKGEKARAGGLKAGFRGMSSRNFRLAHRRGFTNRFKVAYQAVNVDDLAVFEKNSVVDLEALRRVGLVQGHRAHAKILGDGDITVALCIVGLKISSSAKQKIENAGGSVEAEPAARVQEESGDTGSD
jgi:large subunit ribosomal protein L15